MDKHPPGESGPTPGLAATTVASRHNGHGSAPSVPAPDRPSRPPGPSTKPALAVLGVVVLVFVIGVALELAGGNQTRPTPAPTSVGTAPRAGLHAVPARPMLAPIVSTGQPPDDLLNALAVPQGSASVPSSAVNQGVESYDRSLRFIVPATEQAVITFFRAELPYEHWKLQSQGPATTVPGYQLLAQRPASDGLEWELGVTVSPTVFGATPAPGGPTGSAAASDAAGRSATSPGGTTDFTVRLFVQSDDD